MAALRARKRKSTVRGSRAAPLEETPEGGRRRGVGSFFLFVFFLFPSYFFKLYFYSLFFSIFVWFQISSFFEFFLVFSWVFFFLFHVFLKVAFPRFCCLAGHFFLGNW